MSLQIGLYNRQQNATARSFQPTRPGRPGRSARRTARRSVRRHSGKPVIRRRASSFVRRSTVWRHSGLGSMRSSSSGRMQRMQGIQDNSNHGRGMIRSLQGKSQVVASIIVKNNRQGHSFGRHVQHGGTGGIMIRRKIVRTIPDAASNRSIPKGNGLMPGFRGFVYSRKPYNSSLWPNMATYGLSVVDYEVRKHSIHKLPSEITNSFVISMRPQTLGTLYKRLGPWAPVVKHWPATNGRLINPATWIKMGQIRKGCRLTRGQMGCADSHVSIWATMDEHSLPMALILEDDPEFHYSAETSRRLMALFEEIKRNKIVFDLMYLGANLRNAGVNSRRRVSPSLSKPVACVGLFCYIITLAGARKLLQQARPYVVPVDVYTVDQGNSGKIQHVYADPSYGYVFSKSSDTRNIK